MPEDEKTSESPPTRAKPKKGRRVGPRPEDIVPESVKKKAEEEAAAAASAEAGEGGEGEDGDAPKKKGKKSRSIRRGHQKNGKRIRAARKRIDKTKRLELLEGLKLLFESSPKRKFDETVEIVCKLGIDPKKSDQMVRGAISLPNGLGKEMRIIAFAEGDFAQAATDAGAAEVGGEELAKKIKGGWLDFDKAIAHPSMMKHVGALGRILGPQGKMPSPKDGTVTPDVGAAVKEFRLGKVSFRCDDYGNVHVPVGKRNFEPEKLAENIQAFVNHIVSLKPNAAKGVYLQKVVVTTTMGPGVPLSFGL